MARTRWLPTMGLVALLGVWLAACGGGPPASRSKASPVPLRSFDLEGAYSREAQSPSPEYDRGYTVLLDTTVRPHWLASLCCHPITFKNVTAAPLTVIFDHQPISSGSIPPGGSWTWTPLNPESVTFHVGGDSARQGKIQIEAPD